MARMQRKKHADGAQTSITDFETVKKGVVNATDAAKMLGIGKSTVYRLLDSGELPYLQIGKRKVIERDVLCAFWDKSKCRGK